MFDSVSDNRLHTCLLSAVAFLWAWLLKLDLCELNLVLKVPSVSPTYVSLLLLYPLPTVAWYTSDAARQLPSNGHGWVLQLHLFDSALGSVLRMALLCADIFCFMFGMQL